MCNYHAVTEKMQRVFHGPGWVKSNGMMSTIAIMTIMPGMFLAIVNSSPFQAVEQLACPVVYRIYGTYTSKEDVPPFLATNFCAMSVEVGFKITPKDDPRV